VKNNTQNNLKKTKKVTILFPMGRKNKPLNIKPERIVITIVLSIATYYSVIELASEFF